MASIPAQGAPGARPARAAFLALFVAAYLALDWVSYIHPMQQFGITPWNPQPALAIALLLRLGQRYMPAVLAAVLASEWLVRGAALPAGAIVLNALVLTLCYAAIARALSGRFAIRPELDSQRDIVRLAGVVSVGALLTGILYISALLAADAGPLDQPFTALARFWIGDTVGILVTLPAVLMAGSAARWRELAEMARRREAALHAVLVAAAIVLVFALRPDDLLKFVYALLLPLIVVATRLGLVGAVATTLALQLALIVSGEVSHFRPLTYFELQALLIALAVTGLFLGVTVDERARSEAELRRSMRLAAAGEMAAALAHELNQPLTAVANYAQAGRALAEREAGGELLRETLGKLAAEAGRAADVVRRLRDFFRTGATRLEPVDLAELSERVLARLRDSHPGHALELRGAAGAPILADATQLEVVLRNLVANAIEASRAAARPAVAIELRCREDGAAIEVRDNGPGVPAAQAERIFEPFETSRSAGMGMGLAISRAIVEAHGGRLWAVPGTGGCFVLTLPARDAGPGHE